MNNIFNFNKKLFLITLITLLCIIPLSSRPSIYLNSSYDFEFITNEFSNPLPQNGTKEWLEWRQEYPYLQIYDFGFSFDTDLFFSDSGRTGLSINAHIGKNTWQKETIPTGDLSADWNYTSKEATENLHASLSASFGPVFRAQFNILDLGLKLRMSISNYFQDSSIILGIQTVPYMNLFVNDQFFFSIQGLFDFHPMKFIKDTNRKYEEDFNMLTAGIKLGCGFLFGNREN